MKKKASTPKEISSDDVTRIAYRELHDSGISAFFRVLSNNLNAQNSLADNKANIMISINTVVLSLVIGSAARNMDYWQNLYIPILMFVLTSLVTTAFAVLATRPTFIKGLFTADDLVNKKTSLFFFGNYTSLSLKEYEDSMLTVIADDEYLFRSILADFYGQGKVLKRKYRLLSYSYNVFLIGLILSVTVFGIFQYHSLAE